jgi:hypothetical protein
VKHHQNEEKRIVRTLHEFVGDVEFGAELLVSSKEREVGEQDGPPLQPVGLAGLQLSDDLLQLVLGALAQVALVLERHRVEHHERLVLDEEQPIALPELSLEAPTTHTLRFHGACVGCVCVCVRCACGVCVCVCVLETAKVYRMRLEDILLWNPMS